MQLALWNWWWDAGLGLPRAQVIAGVLGVALAIVAILYAWRVAKRQFEVMDEQGQVVDRQLKVLEEHRVLLSRIEAIEGDQREVLKRQGEIAEKQYQVWAEQLSEQPLLRVRIMQRSTSSEDHQSVERWTLAVDNAGTKIAREVNWEILVPDESKDDLSIEMATPGNVQIYKGDGYDDKHVKYLCLFGRLEASLYPGSRNAIVEILSVVAPGVRQEECVQKCEYRLNCTDGAFPRQGYEAFNLRPKFFIDVEADRSQAAES